MNRSRVNRRAVLGLAAGTAATLAAGSAALLLSGGRNNWVEPAARQLKSIVPDQEAAAVVGAVAVPVVESDGRQALIEDIASDLGLSLQQIATASSQDLSLRLANAVTRDSDRGMIVMLDGWIVPRSLARLCALTAPVSA
jgi:hypothetical protein